MTPTATYRLQFRNGMDFAYARKIVPYLASLGISHLYASPIFAATSGSTHGYDVTDHNLVDPTLGGRVGLERLSAELKRAGLGLILDIVPNHMAASVENPWWRDVLEWGEQSRYASHFDIDWSRRLTLPVLGQPLPAIMEAGELKVTVDREHGGLALAYFETRLPLHPASWEPILSSDQHPLAGELCAAAGRAGPETSEALHDEVRALLQAGDTEGLDAELRRLSLDAAFVNAALDQQPWELTFWKDARHTLSYRRFFEVTGLVGVRVEDRAVFDDVHRLTLQLVRDGIVDGLRVDHVDGLADPAAYLAMLREAAGEDTYIIVEKILGEGEQLPASWPIQGSTGYEFIAALADLLTNTDGLERLSREYDHLAGTQEDHHAQERSAKTQVLTRNFEGELSRLATLLTRAWPQPAPRSEDVREAVAALIVGMDVYRTYVGRGTASDDDRAALKRARDRAIHAQPKISPALLDTLCALLLGDIRSEAADEARARFEQLTGPAMAKGIEDTLFYRDHRLLALNEVGCHPDAPAPSLTRFHQAMASRARLQPLALNATATHDTKRGEDARARLMALTHDPEPWCEAFACWRELTADEVEPSLLWMLTQALLGAWPEHLSASDTAGLESLRDRFLPYVEKSMREAKLETSWTEPDTDYEDRIKGFVARLVSPANAAFLEDFSRTAASYIIAGWQVSMVQTLVKLTAPGIPDIYQGSEGEDFSLVDPDNRRPVDFRSLDEALEDDAPLAKQDMIQRVLRLRRSLPDLFADGQYLPLRTPEPDTFAFARSWGDQSAIVIGRRFGVARPDVIGIAVPEHLGDAGWLDVLSGNVIGDGSGSKEILLADRPALLLLNTAARSALK